MTFGIITWYNTLILVDKHTCMSETSGTVVNALGGEELSQLQDTSMSSEVRQQQDTSRRETLWFLDSMFLQDTPDGLVGRLTRVRNHLSATSNDRYNEYNKGEYQKAANDDSYDQYKKVA